MERITRTLTLVEIESPDGARRFITPRDIEVMKGCKVVGRKRVAVEMPLELFVEYGTIKDIKEAN